MTNLNPFTIDQFKKVLKNNFNILLNYIPAPKKKKEIKDEINTILPDNENSKIDFICIVLEFFKILSNIITRKNNIAICISIERIFLLIDKKKYLELKSHQDLILQHLKKHQQQELRDILISEEKPKPLQSSILELVKKYKKAEITENEIEIQNTNFMLLELEREKQCLISQINIRLAKISNDVDDFITTTLSINDPAELDKTDKRMIKTIIDIVHISNSMNVSLRNRAKKNCNQDTT